MRSGVLNVATAKTDNPFYCYFQFYCYFKSMPRSSRWSLSPRFPTESLYVPLVFSIPATRPAHLLPLHLNMWWGVLHGPVTSYLLGSNVFFITLFSPCDISSLLSTRQQEATLFIFLDIILWKVWNEWLIWHNNSSSYILLYALHDSLQ
jgi:hypothetical protein